MSAVHSGHKNARALSHEYSGGKESQSKVQSCELEPGCRVEQASEQTVGCVAKLDSDFEIG